MAAAKKKALPEVINNNPELITLAKTALELRNQIANLEGELALAKKDLADKAKVVRELEETNGKYVGLIRIVDGEQSPCQVQFKIVNGALAMSDQDKSRGFLGAAFDLLFGKDSAVDKVLRPAALIAWLIAKGLDPWQYIEIKVKKGMDKFILDAPSMDANEWHEDMTVPEGILITKAEALMPREGFLATCNEFAHTFTDSAKSFLKNYLSKVLSIAVDLGKK